MAGHDCEVEPECCAALDIFMACQTQWNVIWSDMSGKMIRTGLNYPAVESVMRMQRIPPRERESLLADISVIERAVLDEPFL